MGIGITELVPASLVTLPPYNSACRGLIYMKQKATSKLRKLGNMQLRVIF